MKMRKLSKWSEYMRHFLKKMIPFLLAVAILASVGWYFLVYDTTLTRDLLLHQARRFEENGDTGAAVWLYNLAYLQSGHDEAVAIELAEQFKQIGNYSKAESTLTKAIQDGGGVEVYIALCNTYVEQDKLRDAVNMLDKVANPQIKAQLDALRPAAPVASVNTGTYDQYLQLCFTADSGSIYVATDLDYPGIQDLYTEALSLPKGQTTVYALSIGQNGLVSPLAIYGYIIQNVVEEVTFADSHVENALRQLLQIPAEETVYSNMLWDLEEFTIPAEAASCQDMQWLTGLKKLTIHSCALTDFSSLSALTQLQTLEVTDTTIADSDLGFLTEMTGLTHLTLSGCSISTIAQMSKLTKLEYLDLSNNIIRNISALGGMVRLQELDLSGNALISLADIAGLQGLQALDVSYNSLATTAPVASLTGLRKLDVSSNNLMQNNLEGLEALTELEHFAAAYNNLIDVDVLQNCKKLKTVDVSHNTLLNIQVAALLPMLEELDFSHNEVSRLPSFTASSPLRVIRGEHNMLTSLDNLSGLKNLTYVYMDYNEKLSNINSLQHCKALVEVFVYGTKVTNVSKLADAGILVHYTPKV